VALIFLFPLLFTTSVYSQSTPGLYQSFEKLITINKDNYQKRLEKLSSKTTTLTNIKSYDDVEFDPDFINTILFYTPSRYTVLAIKDKCSLYDLILSGHIKGPLGEIKKFIVKYKDRKDNLKIGIVKKETFLRKIAFKQCPKAEQFFKYFQIKNLKKTLKTVFLKTPKSYDECTQIHTNFVNDYKTPYLCNLYENIAFIPKLEFRIRNTPKAQYRKIQGLKRKLIIAKKYKKILNNNSYDYLKNLCQNIEKPKLFCNDFFQSNFWKKITKGEASQIHIQNMCMEHLKKTKLTPKRIAQCARDFTNSPELCHFLNKYDYALSPKPDCDTISTALHLSRLKANYNDCPAKTGNEAVVNIARLLGHIKKTPKKMITHQVSSCEINSTLPFVELNQEASDGRFWNVKLCYQDKINDKEVCLPTLMGNSENSEYSISNVISKILYKTKGTSLNNKCSLIANNRYKPSLLQFRTGCFVIMDAKSCLGTSCKFKIINNEKEITHITFKSDVKFDYFPNDFIHENMAQVKLIQRFYLKKTRKIINISILKSVMNTHPKALLHGVGCAEDILPSFFKKRAFNQCSPLPFIVDGYLEKDGFMSLVVRTSLDSLHAPRIISWSYIFNSLKAYKNQHPLNTWGLYAIY